jgi:hypothetical protein
MKALIVMITALAGCVTIASGQTYSEEEVMVLAVAVTKVSAATEANLRYGAPSDSLSNEEFMTQSVAHDPGLLAPLSSYQTKVIRQEGHTVILVCSSDGTTALLEDLGCTAALDRDRWRDTPASPCDFTADLVRLCPSASN